MKMVMVIGRANAVLEEMIESLSEYFVVRACTDHFSEFEDMIGISPDAFVVSLMGSEIGTSVFEKLSTVFHEIPVVTIGSEIERLMYMKFYTDGQFSHLNSPVSGKKVLKLLDDMLGNGQDKEELPPWLRNAVAADEGETEEDEEIDTCEDVQGTGSGSEEMSSDTTDETDETDETAETDEEPMGILGIMAMMRGESEKSEKAKKETGQASAKPKVLVVDDDPMMLRGVKSMLDERYQVSLATSGTKAIDMLAKNKPDVILLDYEMPVCDGKKTLEMIRADKTTQDIPVIFLTGVSDKTHIYAVLALRPAGYIVKPAEKSRLLETIEKALAK